MEGERNATEKINSVRPLGGLNDMDEDCGRPGSV